MRCQSCGHDNRATAIFCEQCGTRLAPVCPHCGAEVRPGARFCDACGHRLIQAAQPAPAPDPRTYTPPYLREKILRGRTALEGERRTVTVLFADAVGSTALAERLDEEVVRNITQGCFTRMLDAVHRYEGTVNHFLGDGIMALFGAPIAHEDAARRAVAAALDMQRALVDYARELEQHSGVAYHFRVGLNTGPVVVGMVGDNLRTDYTAIGDTVNLAARMQQVAEPDTVYLSESTYHAVRDYFACEPLGPLTVKGKAEAVVAYKALREKGIQTRIEAATERGLTPFVGRDRELQLLSSYFESAQRGQGQVVFLSGEAGIGKSRLLLEFRHALAHETITWLEGHSISFGKNIAYLPIIDILKRAFGVAEGDSDADIIRRVDDGTAGWDSTAWATVPYLKYLLNVDPGDPAIVAMDPLERRAGIFDALRALVLEASRTRPLVLVVEDLHWMDEMSAEALAVLVDTIAAAPVLLLATYRPGYVPALGERTYATRLHLDALRPEQSNSLLEAMLQVSSLPSQLQHLITGKAEGNPFYIEEVTRALLEMGALERSNGSYTLARPLDQIHIPNTIQEVILSRIDRLEREAKEALQLASVIGREFTVRLLGRISDLHAQLDTALGELKTLELIYQKVYFHDPAYIFKHALTHDVAYATLLVERRKALHRIVAAAVEDLYADRLPEQYETLAYHYSQGEDWAKALEYLEKAGDKATAAYANQDALDFYARALVVCEKLGDTVVATAAIVAQKRGFVHFGLGEYPGAVADFERMLGFAKILHDRHLEGLALVFRGMAELNAHTFEVAEQTLRAALSMSNKGFDDVRLVASGNLVELLQVLNRHQEAAVLRRVVEELVQRIDDPFWRAVASLYLPWAANWAGRFDEALAILERWRAAVEASKQGYLYLLHQWTEAIVWGGKGEYQRALAILEQTLTTAERVGDYQGRMRAPNTIGWIYNELQNHERALEWNMRGVRVAQAYSTPDPEIEGNARVNLGDTLLALDRLDEAEEQFRVVEQVVRTPRPEDHWMLWRYAQHLFHSYGELWLLRGDDEKALAYAGDCLELAEASESRKNIVKARRLRAQVFLAQGKLAEAEQEIDTALQIAQEIGNPPQLWKTFVALGELRQAQGQPEKTFQAYHDALAIIDAVAAGLTDASVRETFLTSPHVAHIRHLATAVAQGGHPGLGPRRGM